MARQLVQLTPHQARNGRAKRFSEWMAAFDLPTSRPGTILNAHETPVVETREHGSLSQTSPYLAMEACLSIYRPASGDVTALSEAGTPVSGFLLANASNR